MSKYVSPPEIFAKEFASVGVHAQPLTTVIAALAPI